MQIATEQKKGGTGKKSKEEDQTVEIVCTNIKQWKVG
jgi:hypothetical protein